MRRRIDQSKIEKLRGDVNRLEAQESFDSSYREEIGRQLASERAELAK